MLLADRHHGQRDGVRGLLETEFETVFMVALGDRLVSETDRRVPAVAAEVSKPHSGQHDEVQQVIMSAKPLSSRRLTTAKFR
jgi:hypothetical protein